VLPNFWRGSGVCFPPPPPGRLRYCTSCAGPSERELLRKGKCCPIFPEGFWGVCVPTLHPPRSFALLRSCISGILDFEVLRKGKCCPIFLRGEGDASRIDIFSCCEKGKCCLFFCGGLGCASHLLPLPQVVCVIAFRASQVFGTLSYGERGNAAQFFREGSGVCLPRTPSPSIKKSLVARGSLHTCTETLRVTDIRKLNRPGLERATVWSDGLGKGLERELGARVRLRVCSEHVKRG
jgi:hypothetical protein